LTKKSIKTKSDTFFPETRCSTKRYRIFPTI